MGEIAVVTKERGTLQAVPDDVISSYLESFGNNLKPKHRNQFIQICKAFQLNPFIREIYGIPYGDNFNIIVGYEVYLKRAERSGFLAGWRVWTEGEGSGLKGCVEISRKDWTSPFVHEVYFSEYNQNNSMWKSKPHTMIKKVAIAQGFRMAFPEELAGMPYTSDEIQVEHSQPTVVHECEPQDAPQNGKPHVDPPKEKANGSEKTITEGQIKMLGAKLSQAKISEETFCKFYEIASVELLPMSKMNDALRAIQAGDFPL